MTTPRHRRVGSRSISLAGATGTTSAPVENIRTLPPVNALPSSAILVDLDQFMSNDLVGLHQTTELTDQFLEELMSQYEPRNTTHRNLDL